MARLLTQIDRFGHSSCRQNLRLSWSVVMTVILFRTVRRLGEHQPHRQRLRLPVCTSIPSV